MTAFTGPQAQPTEPRATGPQARLTGPRATQPGSRRRDPWKTAFFVVAVAALGVGVAWALLGSSFFVVRSVTVAGNGPVPRARVLAAAGIKLGTPLVRVDTGDIARRVDAITRIQSARVRRSWPDSVVITTVPRTATFEVRTRHGYDVLDSYGVILDRSDSPRTGLVRLKSVGVPVTALRGNPAVLAAGAVVRKLPGWLRHRLVAARAAGASRVILILRHGITVVWGGTGAAAAKAAEVAVLSHTKATYYDVSDPQSAMTGWPGGT